MDVYQKKGLAKWVICKWLKRKGVEQWCVTRGEFQNGNFGNTPGSFHKNRF
jgi:hypothetical protein